MEGWRLLFSIPVEIAREVCCLLDNKEIVNLDSAMCCHSARIPLQNILQSADLSGNRPLQKAFGHWCLRKSVPVKQVIVSPSDISAIFSDAKVLQNLPNVNEVVFRSPYSQDDAWPAEIKVLFNAISARQTLTLHCLSYQADVIDIFLEQTAVTCKRLLSIKS